MEIRFYKLLKDRDVFVIVPAIWIDFQTKSLKVAWLAWGIEFDFGGLNKVK